MAGSNKIRLPRGRGTFLHNHSGTIRAIAQPECAHRLTVGGKPDRQGAETITVARMRQGMRARGATQKHTIWPIRGWMIAALFGVALSAGQISAQTQTPPRVPRQQQQQLPQPAPAPPPPAATHAPQPSKPALPPLETLDRQDRRALLRACAQDWEERKRVGRAGGQQWKDFLESCRLSRGSRR